jgi:hypothetical protein
MMWSQGLSLSIWRSVSVQRRPKYKKTRTFKVRAFIIDLLQIKFYFTDSKASKLIINEIKI